MDGISPGNPVIDFGPTSPGWGGFGVVCGAACAPQTCIVEWPPQPWQPTVTPFVPVAPAPYVAPAIPQQHTHYHFTPLVPRLSDEDVERIAKRVAELLKEAP